MTDEILQKNLTCIITRAKFTLLDSTPTHTTQKNKPHVSAGLAIRIKDLVAIVYFVLVHIARLMIRSHRDEYIPAYTRKLHRLLQFHTYLLYLSLHI